MKSWFGTNEIRYGKVIYTAKGIQAEIYFLVRVPFLAEPCKKFAVCKWAFSKPAKLLPILKAYYMRLENRHYFLLPHEPLITYAELL